VRISQRTFDLIDAAFAGRTAAEVGRAFFTALGPFGIRALWSRSQARLEPSRIYARISPPRWEEIYNERAFENSNFVERELPRRSQPFRWSTIELISPGERTVKQVLNDLGFPDGMAAPVHGPGGRIGVTSLAFERLEAVDEPDRLAIGMAATVAHHRMEFLAGPPSAVPPALSPRERDCLAFIAQGMADWEISAILGVAESTVLTHVQNARRKLGARSRAQAVALCVSAGLIG